MSQTSPSSLLITFPGKIGDCLWAAASMKVLAQQPVYKSTSLAVSTYLRNLVPFLAGQDWLDEVMVLEDWHIQDTAPVSPFEPPAIPGGYDAIIHLGMREWPHPTLVEEFGKLAGVKLTNEVWLRAPWNSALPGMGNPCIIFTDEWVELKVGLICALATGTDKHYNLLVRNESRISSEFYLPEPIKRRVVGIKDMASYIGAAPYIVTCKSMARVLAYGLGIPTYVVEPSQPRHNPVFDLPEGWRQDAGLLNGFDAREMLQMLAGGAR